MADLKFCVVCNEGSNREDWKNKKGSYVACDGHSTGEMDAAIKKVEDAKKAEAAQ